MTGVEAYTHQGEVMGPGEGRVRVAAAPHPFKTARILAEMPAGLTLAEILERVQPDPLLRRYAHVRIGDVAVAREHWDRVRPKPGAHVTVNMIVPRGGGGGGKNPLRSLLTIAVAVAAFALGGPVGSALVGAGGLTIGGVTIAASTIGSAIIGLAGTLLISALVPPGGQRLGSLSAGGGIAERDSPTLFITGSRNRVNPFGVVPLVLGKHRVVPPLAAKPYREVVGDDIFFRQLFTFGPGPLTIEQEKIGQTLLDAFDDVEREFRRGYQPSQLADRGGWSPASGAFPSPQGFGDVYTAEDDGTVDGVDYVAGDSIVFNGLASSSSAAAWDRNGDKPFALFPGQVTDDDLAGGVTLDAAAGWVRRTTETDTDEAAVEITFRNGLVVFGEGGAKSSATVTLRVRWRPAGTDDPWTAAEDLVVTGRQTSAIRRARRLVFPTRGQWEIETRRETPDATSTSRVDVASWTGLRSFTNEDPIQHEGLCGVALRIRATGQHEGVIDQYNAVMQSMALDYDALSDQWAVAPTSSPASLYRLVLQGPGNARPLGDGRLALAELEDWHVECKNAGREFNMVIDFASSVWDLLGDIAAAGRAARARPDGKWSVVMDRAQSVPVQHFTPRNSRSFSGEKRFRRLPHGWRVRFVNREKDWEQDERIVYDDGFGPTTATEFEGLELPGRTDPAQVWADGRYHIADLRLRPESFRFETDFEHLVATRGDLVQVAHDVPLFGIASGRVAAVTLDAGGDAVAVTLDETVEMEAGKSYSIRFRLADGATSVHAVTTEAGETRELGFATPIPPEAEPAPPATGDLALFGETGQESVALIVQTIESGDELQAVITCVAAAPEIHLAGVRPASFGAADVDTETDRIEAADHGLFDGDQVQASSTGTLPAPLEEATDYWVRDRDAAGFRLAAAAGGAAIDLEDGGNGTHTVTRQIPPFDSLITAPAALPVPALDGPPRSDEQVMVRAPDGSWISRILLTLAAAPSDREELARVEARFRPAGSAGPWTFVEGASLDPGEISLAPVEGGETYAWQLRYVTVEGRRGPWSGEATHTATGKLGPPSDVTGFAVQQNGGRLTFKWTQVPDRDLSGYEIVFAPRGSFVYASATPVTLVTRGTAVTNEIVPPGDWTFGIKAVDTSGNRSANAATHELNVVNVFDVLFAPRQAPRWTGALDGFVRHDVSGRLMPASTRGDSLDDDVFDRMVPDPVAVATYEGPAIDVGFDASDLRVWAEIVGHLGPGHAGVAAPGLEVDFRSAAGSFDGFESWTVGTAPPETRFVKARVRVETGVGVASVSRFQPTVDALERTDHGEGVSVPAGGQAIAFNKTFHGPPNVQVTVDGDQALFPVKSGVTATGFTVTVYDTAGADVGGTVDWEAVGV